MHQNLLICNSNPTKSPLTVKRLYLEKFNPLTLTQYINNKYTQLMSQTKMTNLKNVQTSETTKKVESRRKYR